MRFSESLRARHEGEASTRWWARQVTASRRLEGSAFVSLARPMTRFQAFALLAALAVAGAAALPAHSHAQDPGVFASTIPTYSSGEFTTTVTLPYAGTYLQTIVSGRTVLCRVRKQLQAPGTFTAGCRVRTAVLKRLPKGKLRVISTTSITYDVARVKIYQAFNTHLGVGLRSTEFPGRLAG